MAKSDKVPGRMGTGAWVAFAIISAGFLYLAAHTYALELGAAQHDAFCPDHGWAFAAA